MKHTYKVTSVLFYLICLMFVSTVRINATYDNSHNNIQPHKEEATTFETSLTEEEFVSSIESQGFSIEKVDLGFQPNTLAETRYVIKKPLTQNAAPRNSGNVPGNHFISTSYKTTNGWKYFVSIYGAGIELASSSYHTENVIPSWKLTYGGQGVTWTTDVQYAYTTSRSISLSSGWIGGSAGSNYIYRTSLVKETSSFNFPIMQ